MAVDWGEDDRSSAVSPRLLLRRVFSYFRP
jgi:hypothetical protein